MRMKAADTSASSAIVDCTPLTVVWRSCTTDAIDTFINDVSTTSTNIAIASNTASRVSPDPAGGASGRAGSAIAHDGMVAGSTAPPRKGGGRPRGAAYCRVHV